jgi:acyl-CoA reductase-like NAD-dependent aldehyde dehydrogenase
MQRTFKVISPIDGQVLLERPYASDTEIELALENAKKAQSNWKQTTVEERAIICSKAIEYFLQNVEEIALELTQQMGRPIRYTPFEIKGGLKERAEHMIDISADALRDIPAPKQAGFSRYIRREALGVVLVLAPWNYPYLTSVNAIIPAIMAGNTVILKHSEQTPLCAERYAAAFKYAGLPEGVFQYLHIDHDQVADVVKDARIDYVAFTGSTEGGAAVQEAIGKRFINAGLELGGKDPAYVRADADLEHAIENIVDGAFFNSGQSCCGIERVYVHESLYEAFIDGFVDLTKQYVLSNPLDGDSTLGPMVRSRSAERVQEQIDDAIAKGAKALIDPSHFENHRPGSAYMAPQVLVNVDHSMALMSAETFGPVIGIMSVKDDKEAIRLMNDSEYGLTASVWTQDLAAAERIGRQIETGTFFMNRCDYLDPALAWTGVKNSGRGATLSALGYEALTRPKSFHLKLLS